jgi:aminoglycoside 6'-N-acetyltransferase I
VKPARIVPATREHLDAWARYRIALWPWDTVADHAAEAERLYLAGNSGRRAFIALDDGGTVTGFAEAALRRDWVEGCSTSPVTFLEGIYVDPAVRQRGVARVLASAVADWGRAKGCIEYASNAMLDDRESHAFHAAIGFEETERVVYFRRPL